MNKDELLEEYKPIKVEITYNTYKSYSITLPVNLYRFEEFIKGELQEVIKDGNNIY